MTKLVAALILAFGLTSTNIALADRIQVDTPIMGPPAPASDINPVPMAPPSTTLAAGTSKNVTVTTASQSVSLTAPSMNVVINNTSTTNTLYFNPFGGAASASNFPIAPGQAFSWGARQSLTQFTLYASGSGTVVGVLAH